MKSGLTIQELAAEILRQKDSKEDYIVNTHRLLVRGHRVETQETAGILRITADAMVIDPRFIAPIIMVPILLVVVLCMILRPKKRKKK